MNRTITILVADDERLFRHLIRVTLEGESVHIIEAEDGDQAIDLTRKHEPDVILMDWHMPKRSGLDATRTLSNDEQTSDVPVIMLTARGGSDDVRESRAAGARTHLTKPFSPLALMRVVSETLGYSAEEWMISA